MLASEDGTACGSEMDAVYEDVLRLLFARVFNGVSWEYTKEYSRGTWMTWPLHGSTAQA